MPVDIWVVENDSDPNGDSFEIHTFDATSVEGGTVSLFDSGTLTYTAPSGFFGTDTFTYDLIDSPNDFFEPLVSNRATVTIEVVEDGGGPPIPAPDARNDIAWTAAGQSIGIFVRSNDLSQEWDFLQITSVTQPGNGVVTFGAEDLSYSPNPGFTSGGDSFQYTVQDAYGQTDTATVSVTMVEVTGYTLEWQQPDGTWVTVGSGEISWSHDNLRWTAHYSPSDPPLASGVQWLKTDWADVDNPNAVWETFASSACDCPAYGNPGAGEWAITPEVHFTAVGPQTDFVAVMQQPNKMLDAEITSVEWATHVNSNGSPSSLAGELVDDPDGFGKRFYPDAQNPGDAARNKVDLIVTVHPARAGIPISLLHYDVDDRSDHDGPIDDDPASQDTDRNNVDNIPDSGGIGYVGGATDAGGTFRTVVTVSSMQPGNNWRIAAAGRFLEFLWVAPFAHDALSGLWYDTNIDGFWDANSESIIDESGPVGGVATSPVLTVWRYLHVEVDSMGAPPTGTVFPDDGEPIDVAVTDVPAPDTGLVAAAFAPAYVTAVIGTPWDEGNAAFRYHLNDADFATQGQNNRGSGESSAFWSVYVQGAYESVVTRDLDPDTEDARDATTHPDEPEYSFIFLEVIRDATEDAFPTWDRDLVEQRAVVHEIGHQFELPHSHEGVMHAFADPNVRTSSFTENSLRAIRTINMP